MTQHPKVKLEVLKANKARLKNLNKSLDKKLEKKKNREIEDYRQDINGLVATGLIEMATCMSGYIFEKYNVLIKIIPGQFTETGYDEDGNFLGNCTLCGARGTIIRTHKCKS